LNKPRKFFALLLIAMLAGCAAHYTPESVRDPYGFFSGIWHGILFPFALLVNIISWFLELVGITFLSSVQLIGRPNTGFFWYYVGFIFGLAAYANR
jgi:hypothetical protein